MNLTYILKPRNLLLSAGPLNHSDLSSVPISSSLLVAIPRYYSSSFLELETESSVIIGPFDRLRALKYHRQGEPESTRYARRFWSPVSVLPTKTFFISPFPYQCYHTLLKPLARSAHIGSFFTMSGRFFMSIRSLLAILL